MPRQTRYYLSDVPQHIIQRGNNHQPTFFAEGDYGFYLECLKEATSAHACEVNAYVLMPNHVHLLLTPRRADSVCKFMQSVGRCYVQYVNHAYNRTGTLWGGRYKASLIDSLTYLLTCYQYIELNPIRANLVQDPADYPWSSYRFHALGEKNNVLFDDPVYLALGTTAKARQAAYRKIVQTHMDKRVLENIRESLHHCGVLGTDRFKDDIEAVLHRPVRPGKRGRPRKTKRAPVENRV
ncbi:MAG: transposase [Gammaproteobacteria bacterium]|jgi:putative transposase|nr:transposase [Gammaproteobacteria bacterium]